MDLVLNTVTYEHPEFETLALPRECPHDPKHKGTLRLENRDYVAYVIVHLKDSQEMEKLDYLPAIIFEQDSKRIQMGEIIEVIGNIHVIPKIRDGTKESDPQTYFFIEHMKSKSREKIKLTKLDIDTLNRIKYENYSKEFRTDEYKEQFSKYYNEEKQRKDKILYEKMRGKGEGAPQQSAQSAQLLSYKLTDEHRAENGLLAKMIGLFAPDIFGLAHIKKALILSAISTSLTIGLKNPRLNILLLGPPGTGKTALLKAIVKLVLGSQYTDAIHMVLVKH